MKLLAQIRQLLACGSVQVKHPIKSIIAYISLVKSVKVSLQHALTGFRKSLLVGLHDFFGLFESFIILAMVLPSPPSKLVNIQARMPAEDILDSSLELL